MTDNPNQNAVNALNQISLQIAQQTKTINTVFPFFNSAGAHSVLGNSIASTAIAAYTSAPVVNSIGFATTSGVIGTTTNDSAAAGSVGEIISSTLQSNASITLSTGVPANVTSISLSAGDWDVWGTLCLTQPSGGGNVTTSSVSGYITPNSGVNPAAPNAGGYCGYPYSATSLAGNIAFPVGQIRQSLAAPTVVYLGTQVGFSLATAQAYGYIAGRRVR